MKNQKPKTTKAPKPIAHWYVVNCYSGSEEKVKVALDNRIKSEQIEDSILQTLIANYTELRPRINREGKQEVVKKTKNTFPGYIFVEMIMTDKSWFIVRNTPGVTGFIGSSGKGAKPFPITQAEVDKVLALQGRVDDTLLETEWSLGEVVEIKEGAMKGQTGKITEFNPENQTATLQVDVFGRKTPTELGLNNLKKLIIDKKK